MFYSSYKNPFVILINFTLVFVLVVDNMYHVTLVLEIVVVNVVAFPIMNFKVCTNFIDLLTMAHNKYIVEHRKVEYGIVRKR